jgi:hypothetical protein
VSPVKITKRSPHGFEVENRDILGLYSSARFGYSNTLPTDIAQNAEYREAGFEGFEDLKFMADPCVPRHLGIGEGTGVSTEYAHTGKYSLKVDAENSVSYFVKFNLPDCPDNPTVNYPYIVDHCDLLPPFMPGFKDRASSYILSLWFRFPQTDQVPNYSDLPGIVIQVNQNPVTINGTTLSPIIERWQKIDVEFELPQLVDEDDIEIIIFNTSGSEDLYLDDVRVFPFNGTMKSYVYDVISLRLVAELDENNFATLYEYDKEGILVRIKKETERGIFTIQETRQHKHLKP